MAMSLSTSSEEPNTKGTMELATVKAEVKAWERAFRAREGRLPTKEDIKKDENGIAEKYALYRRLTKQSSQAGPSSSTSTSQHASSSAGPSRTPNTIPPNDYPTTPTPHSRRGSSSSTARRPAEEIVIGPLLGKRPASSPKSPSKAFITPKKPRPSYSGPVVDPNPVNPFSATPPKPPPSLFPSLATSSAPGSSPFLHASSPRKLKELLESNSLKKVRERQDEITPRTKARLRLTGDFVTPMKDKEPRRRRGERGEKGNLGGNARTRGMSDDGIQEEEEEDGEDEFGPSPMRPGLNRTFTELLQSSVELPPPKPRGKGKEREKPRKEAGPSKQGDLRGFFGMAPGRRKTDPTPISPPKIVAIAATPPRAASPADMVGIEQVEATVEEADEAEERLSTPPPDPETYASPAQTPSRSSRKEKYVSFSDDEVDEWDPEGGNIRRRVFITGTKRNAVRRGSLSSMSGDDDAEEQEAEGDSSEEEQHTEHPEMNGVVRSPNGDRATISLEHEVHDQDPGSNGFVEEGDSMPTLTSAEPTSPTSSARSSALPPPLPPLLSLLSLRSPPSRTSSRINDLRVKAIFNPSHAARLKAVQRGQDIVSGEANLQSDEDEEGLLDTYEQRAGDAEGEEGDDDWDEECDGWKGTSGTMEDDAW